MKAAIALAFFLAATPPVVIEKGLGDAHWPVTTKSAEAQQFFDQGLRYVYAFNHESAVASFSHAAELDPNLAIAYWGAALALGPNINMDVDPDREKQAYELAQKAKAHAQHASAKERDLIDVLTRRYSIDPKADLKQLSHDYSAGMRKLHAKYPDDAHIATLFAESLMDLHPWRYWTRDGKPTEGTEEIVRVLESVLKAHPNHMGANHYYIHAVEASARPDRALDSAKRLTTLAPSAGHLVHMPAHIYQRTGNYDGAAAANVAGAQADREYIKKYGAEGMYPTMYYSHNLDFGAASYAMAGDFAKAKELADEMTANAVKMAEHMPPIDPFTSASMKVLLRFGKWDDVLRAPDAKTGPISTAFHHFARATAFAKLGNVTGARAEQRAFTEAGAKLTDDTGFLQNSGKALGAVMAALIEGRIAEAQGKPAQAVAAYRRAVEAEHQLNYNEPADWFYPARETLGAALLRNHQYAAAEKVFREDLQRNPNNPRSLYGLAEALKGQKKPAASAETAFKAAWRGGPEPLQ